jgi:homoserine dehydrogenase
MPTASAVVADLVNVAIGTTQLAFSHLKIFPDTAERANVLPIDQLRSRYYLRVTVKDEPGVMAHVSHALGQQDISLSAILQRESDESKLVPVVITTHLAQEGAIRRALKEIDASPMVGAPTVCLRVIDQPKEFATG